MKKCILISNCQVKPIAEFLRTNNDFNRQYELTELPPIHTWSKNDIDKHNSLIKKSDIICSQLIISEQYGSACIKYLKNLPQKKVIFPVVYFDGYFPTVIHLKGIDQKIHKKIPIAQCVLPLVCFQKRYSREQATDFINNFHKTEKNFIRSIYRQSLDRLKEKEKIFNLRILASDIIEENFQSTKIMHSLNHPTNAFFYLFTKKNTTSTRDTLKTTSN